MLKENKKVSTKYMAVMNEGKAEQLHIGELTVEDLEKIANGKGLRQFCILRNEKKYTFRSVFGCSTSENFK